MRPRLSAKRTRRELKKARNAANAVSGIRDTLPTHMALPTGIAPSHYQPVLPLVLPIIPVGVINPIFPLVLPLALPPNLQTGRP